LREELPVADPSDGAQQNGEDGLALQFHDAPSESCSAAGCQDPGAAYLTPIFDESVAAR
jgi:hypothetical protein